jgi:hypothetical protein
MRKIVEGDMVKINPFAPARISGATPGRFEGELVVTRGEEEGGRIRSRYPITLTNGRGYTRQEVFLKGVDYE